MNSQALSRILTLSALVLLALPAIVHPAFSASTTEALFRDGVNAYRAGDYPHAAIAFQAVANHQPGSGAYQNLGLAEWQQGRVGQAVLAWERALWLAPFNRAARNDLRFARRMSQLESPDLAWYEVASSWLPMNWWAWIASLSLWLAVGMGILPGIFRVRKAAWHQAVAALGLAVFLLSLPAHVGITTRSRIGFVLQKDTPLRLTPTHEAQMITQLAPGEPIRLERARGNYLLVRASRSLGWVEKSQLGFISP
jgi:tetratricopeptide (TPR) repeat protein